MTDQTNGAEATAAPPEDYQPGLQDFILHAIGAAEATKEHIGPGRELALVITKLEEAQLWCMRLDGMRRQEGLEAAAPPPPPKESGLVTPPEKEIILP